MIAILASLALAQPSGGDDPSARFRPLQMAIDSGVLAGVFPGAVIGVGDHSGLRFVHAGGTLSEVGPAVSRETMYDLASLTKVVALTTSIMVLVDRGDIELDAPVAHYLPRFAEISTSITSRDLLTHTSGLPAWRPLHLETGSRAEALDSLFATRPVHARGERYVYSDLGAIALGLTVEQITGRSLSQFAEEAVFQPLGMNHTMYNPPPVLHDAIAATELDPWRERVVVGEAHDELAVRLGGVAGHAGLFSTIDDLGRFATWLLSTVRGDSNTAGLPGHAVVRRFVARQNIPLGSTRALGWDTPSAEGSSAGSKLSPSSFGHTGYTGTSLWIDPENDLFVILLSNRVHPTRANARIRDFRPLVADLGYEAMR